MKLSAILFTIICSTVATLHASYSNAQAALDKKISIQLKNTSLQDALDQIGSAANVSFTYAGNHTLASNKVNLNARNQKVGDLLNTLLEPFPLSYVVVDERIVVRYDAGKKAKQEAQSAAAKEEYQAASPAPPVVVKGKVTDSKSNPMHNVSVTVKGKGGHGVLTNHEGEFEIKEVNTGAILVFAMTGFKASEEVVTAANPYLTVVLKEDSAALSDVVVTGFKNIDKKRFTGAATTLKADDIKMDGVIDVSKMLEGRAAGVSVQNPSGTFGAAPKIRVRGATSINGDNKPLWVVDGVVLEDVVNVSNDQLTSGDPTTLVGSSVAGLNSNDIESFDILKDAAATALYGARAMNGVVVITTKRGKIGKPTVSYTGNFSTQLKPRYGDYNIMNSAQQMSVMAELERGGILNSDILSKSSYGVYGKMFDEVTTLDANGKPLLENTQASREAFLQRYATANTDWFGLLFRHNLMQEHAISVSSGTDKSQSFFSTSFYSDNGWTIADKVKRYTLNFHNNYKFSDKLSAGFTTVASYRQQRAPGTLQRDDDPVTGQYTRDFDINPFSYALNTSRAITAYDEKGQLEYFRLNFAPFNILKEVQNNYIDLNVVDLKLQGDLTYKFSRHFKYDFVGAIRYAKTTNEHQITENSNMANAYRADGNSTIRANNKFLYRNPDDPEAEPVSVLPYGGFYNRDENSLLNYDVRNTVTYTQAVGERHDISILAGMQVKSADRQSFNNTGYGYQYDNGGIASVDYRILKQTIESNFPYYAMQKTYDRFAAFYASGTYMFDKKYVVEVTGRYDGSNRMGQTATARWLPTGTLSAKWLIDREKFMAQLPWVNYLTLRGSYGLTANMGNATNSSVVLKNVNTDRPYSDEVESVIQLQHLENQQLTWEKNYQGNVGVDAALFNNRVNFTVDFYKRRSFDLINSIKTSGIGGEVYKSANTADLSSSGVEVMLGGSPVKQKYFTWNTTLTFTIMKNKITDAKTQTLIWSLVKAEGGNLEGYPVHSLFSINNEGLTHFTGTPLFQDETGTVSNGVYLQADNTKYLTYEGPVDPTVTGGWANTFRYKQFALNIFLTYQMGNKIRLYPAFSSSYTDMSAMPKEFYDRWVLQGDEKASGVPSIMDAYTAALSSASGNYPYNIYNYSRDRVASGAFVRLKTVSFTYNITADMARKMGISTMAGTIAVQNPVLLYSDKKLYGQDPEFFNSGGVAQPLQKQVTFSLKVGI